VGEADGPDGGRAPDAFAWRPAGHGRRGAGLSGADG